MNISKFSFIGIASPFKMSLNLTGFNSQVPPIEGEAVLIHIHGGGFVSQSTSQHQIYLRRWSKQNNIPVLMTTYRLSPEAEYPQALEDSWQTYRWILDNIESSLGLKPKKILLSGDSAGANLATGLIGLAICKGVRVPDAFISCYPILLLEPLAFTPSRLFTYDEHILNHLLKKSGMRAYLKDLVPQEHPFLSPFFFPDKVLEQFPPTRVVLAGIDPLHDDGYHFAYRLGMLGKDVKVIDNKCLPHGFLNFELAPFVGGECSKAIEAVSKVIKELITDSTEDQSSYQSPFENIRNGIGNNLKKIEEIIEEKFFETTSDLIN